MNRSSNAGDLGVSTKVTSNPDGTYTVQALGKVGQVVGPIQGRTQAEAINLHTQAVDSAAATGKI